MRDDARPDVKRLVCSDECDEHHVYGLDCVANLQGDAGELRRHCCVFRHCAKDGSCGLPHEERTVKETRVDIQREGWTTGSDMPLPRACQTATCIHREHQLSKNPAEAERDLTQELQDAMEKALKYPQPAKALDPGAVLLDLPAISVKRRGLRFWPMLPEISIRIIPRGGWWRRHYQVYAFLGALSQGTLIGDFKRYHEAMTQKDRITQYQQAVYTEIKRRVEAGAVW